MTCRTERFPATVAGAEVSRVSLSFKGGDNMRRILRRMETGLGTAKGVTVGFLADKTYPSTHGIRGTPRASNKVAQVAFWNEFGTKRAPARPFFRSMIEENSPRWGESIAYLAKAHNYNARAIFTNMGLGIQAQLVRSIVEWSDPPNAATTVAIKGFNKPLIDEGIMQNSVDFEVTNRL